MQVPLSVLEKLKDLQAFFGSTRSRNKIVELALIRYFAYVELEELRGAVPKRDGTEELDDE